MHEYAPEGFELRKPTAKRIIRTPKVNIGPNERWAADGHDKTKAIGHGFPIYGFVDDGTQKILGLYVVPNNRLASVAAYCYLDLVERIGGEHWQFAYNFKIY